MRKNVENKVESFDLERVLADVQTGHVLNGNFHYDTGHGHRSHIDLGVNMTGGGRREYRLYQPPGGTAFPMQPGQNVPFK